MSDAKKSNNVKFELYKVTKELLEREVNEGIYGTKIKKEYVKYNKIDADMIDFEEVNVHFDKHWEDYNYLKEQDTIKKQFETSINRIFEDTIIFEAYLDRLEREALKTQLYDTKDNFWLNFDLKEKTNLNYSGENESIHRIVKNTKRSGKILDFLLKNRDLSENMIRALRIEISEPGSREDIIEIEYPAVILLSYLEQSEGEYNDDGEESVLEDSKDNSEKIFCRIVFRALKQELVDENN